MSAPKLAVVPDAPPAAHPDTDPAWETVIDPPVALRGVKDIATNPGHGIITGSRASGYSGGCVCPDCMTLVRFQGRFVGRNESPTGDCIEITCRAAGRGSVGEVRGKQALHLHWTCPRCPKGMAYKQLALEIVSREPAFVAVFLRKASEAGA